ncbi:Peptidoglycan-associated lipoprotein [Vibrio stylophorae]|uniref:Peptidoglycan-associated lipoprotein n=1 Tax=Vibrio stylophorae TaxID=659351 RepID=A0ABN8DTS7_9VIBR|nr:OmpA family protein [Vibrio stylophorae]CAH0533310.1 Peptidoglycan-associated lipoprotein [Vibrio stylophorae]
MFKASFHTAMCMALLFSSTSVLAWQATDHPTLKRFPNAEIENNSDYFEYEEVNVIRSKPRDVGGNAVVDKTEKISGKVTFIEYEIAEKYTALQVYKNYKQVFKKQGIQLKLDCNRSCMQDLNPHDFRSLIIDGRTLGMYGLSQNHLLVGVKGPYHYMLFIGEGTFDTTVYQVVVEMDVMDTDMMSPIAASLQSDGNINLYGIQFDTGKAVLKSSSKDELGQLADVLNQYPELNIDIIGHTDNVGNAKSNLTLSRQRADAVKKYLVKTHGIDGDRLNTMGRGQTKPIASNGSKEGKAHNRRVEIVAVNPETITSQTQVAQGQQKKSDKPSLDETKKKVDDTTDKVNGVVDTVEDAVGTVDRVLSFF